MSAVTCWFPEHIAWKIKERQLRLTNVRAIPNQPMPVAAIPTDWASVRVGPIKMSMPAELAKSRRTPDKGGVVLFQNETVSVMVVANQSDQLLEMLDAASRLDPQKRTFTLPKLLAEFYRAGADDFHWSMTPAEVRWHAFRLSTGFVARLAATDHTESLSHPDWDGFASFTSKFASLNWQSADRKAGGYIHFIGMKAPPDPDWVRAICQSIRLADVPMPSITNPSP